MTAPPPEGRAADLVICRFNNGNGGITIGGRLYRIEHDDAPAIRAAIAEAIRAAEEVARTEVQESGARCNHCKERQIEYEAYLCEQAESIRLARAEAYEHAAQWFESGESRKAVPDTVTAGHIADAIRALGMVKL